MKLAYKKLKISSLNKHLMNTIKIHILILLTTFSILQCGNPKKIHPKKKYTFAFPKEGFPPFEFKKGYNYGGINIDLLKITSHLTNIDYEIKFVAFKDIIPMITTDRIDATLVSTQYTPQQKKMLTFSKAYYENSIAMMMLNKKESKDKVEDKLINISSIPKEKRVGVIRGSFASQIIENNAGKYQFKVQYFQDLDSSINTLINKKIDCILGDYVILEHHVHSKRNKQTETTKPFNNNYFKFILTDFPKTKYQLAVKKDKNKPLITLFNTILQRIKKNGTLDRIVKKYISKKIDKNQKTQN